MHSFGIRPIWLATLVVSACPAFSEVGEFLISDDLIREMQIVTTQNTPFTKENRQIEPSLTIQITPTLKDSDKDISFNLKIDLNGTSKSRSFTPVRGNRGVTADVTAQVRASFEQELSFDGEKVKAGGFTGSSEITPGEIRVQNNFGLLNRAVNRRARQQAPAQVQSEIPQEKKELEEKIREEIQNGLGQTSSHLENLQQQIHQVFTEKNTFPFDSKFSSRSGPDGGIQLSLIDQGKTPERNPKPDFSLQDQIASSGVFHQDLLTETLSKELAGKEMKIAELKAYLCSPNIASLINFCEKGDPAGSLGLSVIFDDKDPIKFKFEDGKVSLQINAKNRVGVSSSNNETSRFLTPAGAPKGAEVDMEPYQVNISYALKEGAAVLEGISVRGRTETETSPEKSKFPSQIQQHDKKNTLSSVWSRVTATTDSLVSSVTKTAIENEFRKIMKEKIEFPIVSFPTKIKTDPKQNPMKAEVLEAASLVPMEVKAEKGWLAVSATLCKENIKSLGVSFDKDNRISAIQAGSPAALVGFRLGDRIESYASPDGRNNALMSDVEPFLEFVKEHSVSKSTSQRVVELSGKTGAGIPFKRQVSLCPSQLNHREEAEKILSLGGRR